MEHESRRRGVYVDHKMVVTVAKGVCRLSNGSFLPRNKHGVPVPRVALTRLSRLFSRWAKGSGRFRKNQARKTKIDTRDAIGTSAKKKGIRFLRSVLNGSSVRSTTSIKGRCIWKRKQKPFRTPLCSTSRREQASAGDKRPAVLKRATTGLCFAGRHFEQRAGTHIQQRSGRADPEISGGARTKGGRHPRRRRIPFFCRSSSKSL